MRMAGFMAAVFRCQGFGTPSPTCGIGPGRGDGAAHSKPVSCVAPCSFRRSFASGGESEIRSESCLPDMHVARWSTARGLSLVELLVTLVMASLVAGAVSLVMSGSLRAARAQASASRASDNGQMALHLLATHLRRAGFQMPTRVTLPGEPVSRVLPAIVGCATRFADPHADFESLACSPGGGAGSLAIRYQSGQLISAPMPDRENVRRHVDCLRQFVGDAEASGEAAPSMVDNRFHIGQTPDGPALYCKGNGSDSAQALVPDIESMDLLYGVAAGPLDASPEETFVEAHPVRYLTSTEVAERSQWSDVVSVRICVTTLGEQVQSREFASYQGCDGAVRASVDGRVRRVMSTTAFLENSRGGM